MSNVHEVDFYAWCPKCRHEKEDEFDVKSKCYDCLDVGYNTDSRKPIGFQEKKSYDKQRNRKSSSSNSTRSDR